MSDNGIPGNLRKRLNLLAWAPAAAVQFRLLSLAVLLSIWQLGTFWEYRWGPDEARLGAVFGGGVGYIGLLLLLTWLRYRSCPARLLTTYQARPLAEIRDTVLTQRILGLLDRFGDSPVEVFVGRSMRSEAACAFGSTSRPSILLGGQHRLLVRKLPERFDAIFLHEYAHILNGDLRYAFISLALTEVTLALGTTHAVLWVVWFGVDLAREMPSGDDLLWSCSALVTDLLPVLIIMGASLGLYAFLLRSRELHADWRAASLGGSIEDLHADSDATAPRRTGKDFVLKLFHPSSDIRKSYLIDPTRTLGLPSGVGFVVGMTGAWLTLLSGQLVDDLQFVPDNTIDIDTSASFLTFQYHLVQQMIGQSPELPFLILLMALLNLLLSLCWASTLTSVLLGGASLAVAAQKGAPRFLGRTLLFYLAFSVGVWIGFVSNPSMLFAVDLTKEPLVKADFLRLSLPIVLQGSVGVLGVACLSPPLILRLFRSFPDHAPSREVRLLLHVWAFATIWASGPAIASASLMIVAAGEIYLVVLAVAAFYGAIAAIPFLSSYVILGLLQDRRRVDRSGEPPAWMLLPSTAEADKPSMLAG